MARQLVDKNQWQRRPSRAGCASPLSSLHEEQRQGRTAALAPALAKASRARGLCCSAGPAAPAPERGAAAPADTRPRQETPMLLYSKNQMRSFRPEHNSLPPTNSRVSLGNKAPCWEKQSKGALGSAGTRSRSGCSEESGQITEDS